MKLVKVRTRKDGTQVVNARDLWEFLEVGRHFNSWIKGRIEKYDFIESEDFTIVSLISQNGVFKKGGDRKSLDYIITLDMAKELAMIENNLAGRLVRKYFIQCEKKYRKLMINNHNKKIVKLEAQISEANKYKDKIEFLTLNYEEIKKLIETIYEEHEKSKKAIQEYNMILHAKFFQLGISLNETETVLKKLKNI